MSCLRSESREHREKNFRHCQPDAIHRRAPGVVRGEHPWAGEITYQSCWARRRTSSSRTPPWLASTLVPRAGKISTSRFTSVRTSCIASSCLAASEAQEQLAPWCLRRGRSTWSRDLANTGVDARRRHASRSPSMVRSPPCRAPHSFYLCSARKSRSRRHHCGARISGEALATGLAAAVLAPLACAGIEKNAWQS